MTFGEEDPQFLEHIKEAWPGLSEDEYPDLLMNITCFPFGTAAKVVSQLKELHEQSGGDIGAAMGIVDNDIKLAHDEFKRKYPEPQPEAKQ